MKGDRLLAAVILGVSAVVIQPELVRGLALSEVRAIANTPNRPSSNIAQPESQVLSAPEISKIGKAIVVRIESDRSQGSGVIIRYSGNKYTVLTAFHVVYKPNKYRIVTADGERYNLDNFTLKRLPNLDLATLEFTSSKKYQTARMLNSYSYDEGSTIYVAGFSARTSTVKSIYRAVDGKISAIDRESPDEGYGLIYTNNTLEGMSGGAVLNDKGELIGIHGRAETKAHSSFLGSEQIVIAINTGFNLGIPIDVFNKAEIASASNSQGSSDYKRQNTTLRTSNIPATSRPASPVIVAPINPASPVSSPTNTTSKTKFVCSLRKSIPTVYVRTVRGSVPMIALTKSPNLQNCNSIAKRFQTVYDKGNLRVIKSFKWGSNNFICAVKSKDELCTEENILFRVPDNTDSNLILARLLDVRSRGTLLQL